MKARVVNLDIYRRSVVVLQGSTGELNEWFSANECDNLYSAIANTDWNNTMAITFDNEQDVYICAVADMDLPTLSHELSHATLRILKIVGIDPIVAEEAYAYLYEYLFTQITSSDDAQLQLSKDAS